MEPHPIRLEKLPEQRLLIEWSDGERRVYRFRELQDHCPCATCREKRKSAPAANPLQVISPQETQPLELVGMRPVGSYAYHISFNYGCESGIYTFELLRQLGHSETPR